MNIATFFSEFSLIAQTPAEAALPSALSGGVIVVAAASLAGGYITGRCVWREDRNRIDDTEKVNVGLRARIDEISTGGN